MATNDNSTYILVKDENDVNVLCPLSVVQGKFRLGRGGSDECVEADVVGRYAGNIEVKSS